jgi:diacylglycerol kinase family enzyme
LGAAVARGANTGIRRLAGDSLGTLLCLLHALARFRPRRVLLSLDGRQTRLEGVLNVAVGKTHYIASGLRVRHALEAQDRRLYVLCARDVSLRTLLPALRALYSGQPIRPGNGLSLAYAEQICVEPTDAPVEVEFDGDPAGNCPCRIETAIDSLDLLVSNALRGQPL